MEGTVKRQAAVVAPLSAAEVERLELIELMFFAYKDFTADADRILERIGFGRAHHRALYFVNRRPGLTVAELLDILAITKQSLARVLKQLVQSGHIVQKTGPSDRRQRLLYPTDKGRALIMELSRPQSRRIGHALQMAGADAGGPVSRFLGAMAAPAAQPVPHLPETGHKS